MGGQHLAVGVDVDAQAFGLLQQLRKVRQVVAGDQDAGALADAELDLSEFGVAVGAGVGLVQQGHAGHRDLAGLHGQVDQCAGFQLPGGGGERLGQEGVDLLAFEAEHRGVVGIGGDALQAVDDQFLQGAQVLVAFRQHADLRRFGLETGLVAFPGGHLRQLRRTQRGAQLALHPDRLQDLVGDPGVVEVGVGDGQEQALGDEQAHFLAGRAGGAGQFLEEGQALEVEHQQIHEIAGFGLLAAGAADAAAFVPGGFLALETEHGHGFSWRLNGEAFRHLNRSRSLCLDQASPGSRLRTLTCVKGLGTLMRPATPGRCQNLKKAATVTFPLAAPLNLRSPGAPPGSRETPCPST